MYMNEKVYITAEEIDTPCCDKDSQETSINWCRDEDIAQICSSDITFVTKMKNMMLRDPEHYRCYYYKSNLDKNSNRVICYCFEVPKSLLTFRVGSDRRGKNLSDEEKIERKNRLKKND